MLTTLAATPPWTREFVSRHRDALFAERFGLAKRILRVGLWAGWRNRDGLRGPMKGPFDPVSILQAGVPTSGRTQLYNNSLTDRYGIAAINAIPDEDDIGLYNVLRAIIRTIQEAIHKISSAWWLSQGGLELGFQNKIVLSYWFINRNADAASGSNEIMNNPYAGEWLKMIKNDPYVCECIQKFYVKCRDRTMTELQWGSNKLKHKDGLYYDYQFKIQSLSQLPRFPIERLFV